MQLEAFDAEDEVEKVNIDIEDADEGEIQKVMQKYEISKMKRLLGVTEKELK